PGVFSPGPAIGGLQSSGWLYVLWHVGFPLFVLSYAFAKDGRHAERSSGNAPKVAIAWSVFLTASLVAIAAVVCIADDSVLPRIMLDPARFSPAWPYLVGTPIAL